MGAGVTITISCDGPFLASAMCGIAPATRRWSLYEPGDK